MGVQRGDDLRAFTDSRSNALDGFRADISDGEDATPAGLQCMGRGTKANETLTQPQRTRHRAIMMRAVAFFCSPPPTGRCCRWSPASRSGNCCPANLANALKQH